MQLIVLKANSSSAIPLPLLNLAEANDWPVRQLEITEVRGLTASDPASTLIIYCVDRDNPVELFLQWYQPLLTEPAYCQHHILLTAAYNNRTAATLAQYADIAYIVLDNDLATLATHFHNLVGSTSDLSNSFLAGLRNRFGQIIDHSSIISITNKRGDILYANDRFCEISGYSREELFGQNHRLLRSETHDQQFYRTMWQTLLEGNPWYGDICNKTKEQGYYWVKASIYPIFAEDREIQAFISIRNDITAKVALQEMLLEREERLRITHAFARVGHWEWNLKTKKLSLSEEASQLMGLQKSQHQHYLDVASQSIHPDDYDRVLTHLAETQDCDSEFNIEHRIVHVDGSIRWLQQRGRIQHDNHGQAVRLLGITSDIHELKIAQEQAIEADKIKSRFISMLSHEIRNPLNAIAGYNRLNNKTDNNQTYNNQTENNHYSDKINQIIHHIAGILDDVHLNSKLESGQITNNPKAIVVSRLFQEALEIVSQVKNNITIVCDKTDYWVFADEKHIKQIIVNLLTNAIKYNSPNGHVFLRASEQPQKTLRISITDTGSGISAEKIPLIFKPYERLEWLHSDVEGLGLGLSICQKLAASMQTLLQVESTPDVGSTFWIDLPLASPLNDNKSPTTASADHLPTRVLILEDNEFNQEFMRIQMKRLGIFADIASNGREGLALLGSQSYDVILSDVNMPIMDGLEFTRQVRASENPHIKNLKIVLITAEYSLKQNSQTGANSVLAKPFTEKELLEALSLGVAINSPAEANHKEQKTESYQQISLVMLERYLSEDPVKKCKFIKLYQSLLSEDIDALVSAWHQRNYQHISVLAHKLSSSSLSIGAKKLHHTLKDIHQQIQENKLQQADNSIQQVLSIIPVLNHELEILQRAIEKEADQSYEEPYLIEHKRGCHILIVDDDKIAAQQLQQTMEHIDALTTYLATSPQHALALLKTHAIDIIAFDINMPDTDGLQFIRMLSDIYEGQGLIVYSGEQNLINSAIELIQHYNMISLGSLKKPAVPMEVTRLLSLYRKIKTEASYDIPNITDEELLTCINTHQVIVYFQPQVCLKTKRIIAAEALSRVIDSQGKIIPPLSFIHRLIFIGKEVEYSLIVAEKAIAQLSQWRQSGHDLCVAINFSMLALEELILPEAIIGLCHLNQVSPEYIIIEVTETELTTQPKHAVEVLSRLKLKGFTLSIDDFGTGYASLDKLKKLPFSEMKLDRSYVSTAKHDEVSMALLVSSLGLAHTLGISSVAEGIETEEDLKIVTHLGANTGQGFLFSKPVPAEEWEHLLETFNGKQ